jgi:hypothetical protein
MTRPGGALIATILFIPLSVAEFNLEADWAEAGMQVILRHCPICSQDSIVGHGRRRKQAHDQHHDWIGIRRGLCNRCGKTFTFLPPFSPPYGHYSFIARSQALQNRDSRARFASLARAYRIPVSRPVLALADLEFSRRPPSSPGKRLHSA